MARSHPHLGVHQNGGVHAHVSGGLLHKLLPPGLFHVVFKLHAQGAVVPGVGKPAVNLAAGEDKAPGLAEVDDGIHSFFACFHSRWSAFLACNRVAGDIVPCSPPECNPVPGFSSRALGSSLALVLIKRPAHVRTGGCLFANTPRAGCERNASIKKRAGKLSSPLLNIRGSNKGKS